MQEISRSALLPYPAAFLYGLVNDIASYPEFLPWCEGAEVLDAQESEMVASLQIHARGIRSAFTTRNCLDPHRSIRLELVEGPFAQFHGQWRFDPIGGDAGCRVSLEVRFTLNRGLDLLSRTLRGSVGRAADRVLDAFAARARELAE